jgi:hypothetical protein
MTKEGRLRSFRASGDTGPAVKRRVYCVAVVKSSQLDQLGFLRPVPGAANRRPLRPVRAQQTTEEDMQRYISEEGVVTSNAFSLHSGVNLG